MRGVLDTLRSWLFATGYAKDFTGMSNRQLAESFEMVDKLVSGKAAWPHPSWDTDVTVEPINIIRRGAVRTTMFALCLSGP